MTEKKSKAKPPLSKRSSSKGLTAKLRDSKTVRNSFTPPQPKTPGTTPVITIPPAQRTPAGWPPRPGQQTGPQTPPPTIPQTIPQTAPRPVSGTGPQITLPASQPAPAQDAGADLERKKLRTAGGKALRGRAQNMLQERVADQQQVDVSDLENNFGVYQLMMSGGLDAARIPLLSRAMQSVGMTTMTQATLMKTIADANAAYEQIKDLGDNDALPAISLGAGLVAFAMRERQRLEDRINRVVRTDQVSTLDQPHLLALTEFLEANPGFCQQLGTRDVGFLFNSTVALSQGGGVFSGGNIHTLGKDDLDPRKWLQIMVHEAGHATYQRMLLGNPTPPGYLDTGKLWTLREEIAQMRADAEDAGDTVPVEDPASPYNQRYRAIQKEFDDNGARAIWAGMPKDARDLYDAWGVLRQNGGAHLLALDMGPGMSPPERRAYQVNNFIEFIAESFMQVATGEMKDHYDHITTDATVPDEVKAAWDTAWDILDRQVRDTILGWDAMW